MIRLAAIVRKEMRLTLRERWFVVSLGLLMAAVAAGIGLTWLNLPDYEYVRRTFANRMMMDLPLNSGTYLRADEIEFFTPVVFMEYRTLVAQSLMARIAQMAMLGFGLLTALLAATTVTREREGHTYDSLIASGFRPAHLIWGKWMALMGTLGLAFICLSPMLALVFQLGGLSLIENLTIGALVLTAIATYGMIGLAASALLRKSLGAMMVSLFIAATLLLLPLITDGTRITVMTGNTASTQLMAMIGTTPTAWLRIPNSNPLARLSPLILVGRVDRLFIDRALLISNVLLELGLFAAAFLLARWGLRRRETGRQAAAQPVIDDAETLRRRRRHWPYYMIDPLRRPQSIGDDQNPVQVKEKRVNPFYRPQSLVRLVDGAIIFSLASVPLMQLLPYYGPLRTPWQTVSIFDRGSDYFIPLLSVALILIAALFVPPLAATLVSHERENGTLDLLLATPASSLAIVLGKFKAVFRLVLAFSASFAAFPIVYYCAVNFVWTSEVVIAPRVRNLFVGAAIMLLYLVAALAYLTAVGLWSSTRRRTNTGATATCYATVFGLALLLELAARLPYAAVALRTGLTLPASPLKPSDNPFARWGCALNPIRLLDATHGRADRSFGLAQHPYLIASLILALLTAMFLAAACVSLRGQPLRGRGVR